jgi:ADP-ribosylation factor protein 6
MGASFSDTVDHWFQGPKKRCLMIGLSGAGKKTFLEKCAKGKEVQEEWMSLLIIRRVEYKGLDFESWDVGWGTQLFPLYRHLFARTQGLIFVADAYDRSRIDEARDELDHFLYKVDEEGERGDVSLLVYAMEPEELAKRLQLSSLLNRTWHIRGSCAITGQGLDEGLEWLSNEIKKKS